MLGVVRRQLIDRKVERTTSTHTIGVSIIITPVLETFRANTKLLGNILGKVSLVNDTFSVKDRT